GEVAPPPSATQLEKEMAGHVAPISAAAVAPQPQLSPSDSGPTGDGRLHLIGTVGDRAVLLMPDGQTSILASGSTFDLDGGSARLLSVNAHSAEVDVNGKKKSFQLEAAQNIIEHATALEEMDNQQTKGGTGGRKGGQSISGGR
ncbi:MAG: hypothetical protein P4M15_10150, partial [Alphaproteobacteria bacterium]|nr:hypothetical protein [Alphaproteobacteria bacterium]